MAASLFDSSFVASPRRAFMPQPTSPQPQSQPGRAPIRLLAQVLTCVAFSLIALAVIFTNQSEPVSVLRGPMTLGEQLLLGLGLSAVASYLSFRFTAKSQANANTIRAYGRLDLSGFNPVWISLAAAIGEELLFRAALQPLRGVWITSAIFVLAHTPVYQFRGLNKATLVQATWVFGASVALGFIYQYVGLLAAMMVHTAFSVIGLYVMRNVLRGAR
jgi:membrane protease YdiL (CAAX protease family)